MDDSPTLCKITMRKTQYGGMFMEKITFCLFLLLFIASCSGAPPTPGTSDATSAVQLSPSPTPTTGPIPSATPTRDKPEPGRPLLMAHYMPWYQTPSVSGYWGWHWTMEHFHPSQLDEKGQSDIASYVMPLTGPYDSNDDALLEYQVLLMKLSGIDGVIVDWYGMEDFWDYAVLNESTHKLFGYIQQADLQFAICYEDQTIKHMVDNKHLAVSDVYTHGQAVMQYLQQTWFRERAYLKVAGHPALFVFGPQYFANASDWDKLFADLDPRPAFITLDKHIGSASMASYPWPPMWASEDGILSQEALEDYLADFYRKAGTMDYVVAGAFPGFKDIYQQAGIADETRYLDPRQGETFQFTLQSAIDQKPDVIQLITWNDYGETTSIEPTEEYGYQYLEMVQQARREMDTSFSYKAEDLRLPLRIFTLRNQYVRDTDVNAAIDIVVETLLAGDGLHAQQLLDKLETP